MLVMPTAAGRLPPSTATWTLSVGGLLVAAATGWSLTLLGLQFLGRIPTVDHRWGWSPAVLAAHDRVPAAVGGLALVLLPIALTATARAGLGQWQGLRRSHRLAAALAPARVELVVTADAATPAQAVPGHPGRVVVSAALLAALTPAERRIVLAHERAHLAHRHHLHLAAIRIAAAANPLLRPLVATTGLCVEMWADRDAAAVSDPAAVARTLVRVARETPAGPADLAAAATATTERVRRLLAGSPGRNVNEWLPLALLLALGVCATLAGRQTELLFEAALRATGR